MLAPFATGIELKDFAQRSKIPSNARLLLDLASGAIRREAPLIEGIDAEADPGSAAVVKLVTLQLAARLLNNPDLIASESAGNASTTYQKVERYLTEEEKDLVAEWRKKPTAGSVRLRTNRA